MSSSKDELVLAARAAAAKWNLPPDIVCGIVERETTWNPWASRYEPKFYDAYIYPLWLRGIVKDITEAQHRSTSWGLMQVMGQVAREMRFSGDLPSLCDPAIGLDYGCQLFAKKLSANASLTLALASYNGGANPHYAAEVLDLSIKYQSPEPSGGKAISA